MFSIEDYDYHLPEENIAQRPAAQRDRSRLLVLERNGGAVRHKTFRDLPEYLSPSDVLVLNNTRVIPARLVGRKETGGRVELLLLNQHDDRTWEALVRGKGLRPGTRIELQSGGGPPPDADAGSGHKAQRAERLAAEIITGTEAGGRLVRFDQCVDDFFAGIATESESAARQCQTKYCEQVFLEFHEVGLSSSTSMMLTLKIAVLFNSSNYYCLI